MTTRRYGDDEVREIFSLATTGDAHDRSLPMESGGLTLDELQRIGEEAGIEPARVARAAASLDARGRPALVRRSLGLPIGVTRVVDLPRAPTDREWERLIAGFRSTFGVQGTTTSTGGLRQWSQGNLHVSIEPTAHGEQLRLSTLNGEAQAISALGILMSAMSVLMGAVVTAAGKPGKALVIVGMFGGMALFAFGANLFRLPRWARLRERQMTAIADDAVQLLSDGGDNGPPLIDQP
jgi:hypothetical protein